MASALELHLDLVLQPMGCADSLSFLPVDPCPPILPMSLRNIGRGSCLWAHLVGTKIETGFVFGTRRYLSSGCPFPNNTRRLRSAQRLGQSSATAGTEYERLMADGFTNVLSVSSEYLRPDGPIEQPTSKPPREWTAASTGEQASLQTLPF
jgi:hypothetical protein